MNIYIYPLYIYIYIYIYIQRRQTVRKVVQKADLNWNHFQRKGILTKNDLKLRLKFA